MGIRLAHSVLGIETWFLPCSVLSAWRGRDSCVVQAGPDGPEAQTWGAGVGVFVSWRVGETAAWHWAHGLGGVPNSKLFSQIPFQSPPPPLHLLCSHHPGRLAAVTAGAPVPAPEDTLWAPWLQFPCSTQRTLCLCVSFSSSLCTCLSLPDSRQQPPVSSWFRA